MRFYLRILVKSPNRSYMAEYPLWAQALNISEEKWKEWCKSLSDPASILMWGLTHEQISWSTYWAWAKGHYELCYLDDTYFQLEDTIGDELQSCIDPALWRPWAQPLYMWDDVVYVACLEPTEFTANNNKQFVSIMCSPWQLESRWEKIKKYQESPKDPNPTLDVPEGIILNNSTKVHLNMGEKESPQPPTPTSMTQQSQVSLTNNTTPIHLTQFNFEAAPQQGNDETSEFGPINVMDAPSDINSSLKEREIIAWLFNQLQPYFEMMWWVELNDEKATVKWWHPGKKFDPSQLKVDTHTPSFFRIVKKTKMPYHGHIVDSVTHQTFFGAFGDSSLPAHVTALPVILQSNFREMLVGSSNQKQQDPQTLIKVEKILEKALQVIESQRKPTQKTA